MLRRLLVDRKNELDLFDSMAAGSIWKCILLLEAAGGLGKSTLLREFERRGSFPATCVTVDFKGDLGLVDVFCLVGRGVGMDNLPRFGALVARMSGSPEAPLVRVSRNVLIGRAEISVALQAEDEETRRARRAALTDALLDELETLERRVVLIFDTLNDAAPDARDWLLGPFLSHVRHCQNVAAVVGSRPPLEVQGSWAGRCEHIRLQGITEPEDWLAGLRLLGAAAVEAVPLEWIRAYCACFDGHPMQMMTALERVIGAGKGGGR